MKHFIFILILGLCLPFAGYTQQQGSIWTFGKSYSVRFTTGGPSLANVPGTGNNVTNNMPFFRSNAVCDVNGNLLFFVKIKNTDFIVPPDNPDYLGKNIYDANGNAMTNSDLVAATPTRGPVHIIKRPGANKQYYVIYSLNQGLFATTVDMSLNNGLGGVVTAEKSIMLSSWQTVVGEKTAVIQGCDCIWLLARSRTSNQYKAYRITEAGINLNPVISDIGLLPLSRYNTDLSAGPYGVASESLAFKNGSSGLLKASQDGSKVVACCDKGLELYDFHKCDGTLSDARLIDTTSTQIAPIYSPSSGMQYNPWPVGFYSACFSEDNSKLYATYMFSRHVYQYDLSQPTIPSVMASKTVVLSNQYTVLYEISGCGVIDTPGMGDLKMAPDGKIYIGNAAYGPCDTAGFPNAIKYNALHAINYPNLAGTTCSGQQNAFILSYLWGPDHRNIGVDFPPDMVLPPPARDSVHSYNNIFLCHKDLLLPDTTGSCYHWNTGATTATVLADTAGLYTVQWSGKDCTFHKDSFQVYFSQFPTVDTLQKLCPEDLFISASQNAGDTSVYDYKLTDSTHAIVQAARSGHGFRFQSLYAGRYYLNITAPSGCDTDIDINLEALQKPQIITAPSDTVIRYGDSIRIHASGALYYVWTHSAPLDSSYIANPLAYPTQPTLFLVMGLAENGCRDTGFVKINIDYTMPSFIPNAFSPNGDGLNDVFNISGIHFQRLLCFQVFNRFGQQIFSTLNPATGWDGTFKDKACDAGTYYYFIKLAYPDGKIRTFKGDLTLIR